MRGRIVVALSLTLAWTRDASACKCGKSATFEEASATADLAFEGKVVRRWPTLAWDRTVSVPYLSESYDFSVTRPIRGDFSVAPRLYFGFGDCGMRFDEGGRYRVVAYRDRSMGDRFSASWCSPNEALPQAPSDPPPAAGSALGPREALRFLLAVAYGSVSSSFAILKSESWNPFEQSWRNRWMTAAALAYPALWFASLLLAFRLVRKGWTRRRAVGAILFGTVIPYLALILARDDWFFAAATR